MKPKSLIEEAVDDVEALAEVRRTLERYRKTLRNADAIALVGEICLTLDTLGVRIARMEAHERDHVALLS